MTNIYRGGFEGREDLIKSYGGKVIKEARVVSANINNNIVDSICLDSGEIICGSNIISSLHPLETIKIFGESNFRKLYVNRIKKINNSISAFTLNLSFKKDTFRYINHNI